MTHTVHCGCRQFHSYSPLIFSGGFLEAAATIWSPVSPRCYNSSGRKPAHVAEDKAELRCAVSLCYGSGRESACVFKAPPPTTESIGSWRDQISKIRPSKLSSLSVRTARGMYRLCFGVVIRRRVTLKKRAIIPDRLPYSLVAPLTGRPMWSSEKINSTALVIILF